MLKPVNNIFEKRDQIGYNKYMLFIVYLQICIRYKPQSKIYTIVWYKIVYYVLASVSDE